MKILLQGLIPPTLLFLAALSPTLAGVPAAPCLVTTSPGDRRVFVQDRRADGSLSESYSLIVKGVNWSPASPGTDPAADPVGFRDEFQAWAATDIPLMAEMGVNTVRLYHDLGTDSSATEILDLFYQYGIKVMMPVDSPLHGNVANLANVATVVNAYKNHPAILFWVIGNEWDLNFYYGTFSTLGASAAFTETAAQLIKTLDSNHPVATVIADPHIPEFGAGSPYHYLNRQTVPFSTGPFTDDLVNAVVPSVDVWGINLYRGASFADALSQWASISNKPVFIGEFGADSYDHDTFATNEPMQASFNATLWNEIAYELAAVRQDGISLGGLVFELTDEWWKNGDPSSQLPGTETNYGQPDRHNDEEYFGLTDIDRTPNDAFWTMKERFAPDAFVNLPIEASPVLRVTSMSSSVPARGVEIELNGRIIYARGGGQYGGRGINIAVIDSNSGVRASHYAHFDTFHMTGGWGGGHAWFEPMADYLNSLPTGSIIAIGIADEGGFIDPNLTPPAPWQNQTGPETGYQALEALGSTRIRDVGYRGGWAMIAIKGQGVIAEQLSSAQSEAIVEATLSLTPRQDANLRPGPVAGPVVIKGITPVPSELRIDLDAPDGTVVQVDYSKDLKTWNLALRGVVVDSGTGTWTDDGTFTDSEPNSTQQRFYRFTSTDRAWRP